MTLRDDIEAAVAAAMEGTLPSNVENDARVAVRAVLARHGVHNATVRVVARPGRVDVDVDVPPGTPRVEKVQLRLF